MDILLLIAGLVLILVGANMLTDGASAVANRFNISHLVIGLTIVAFGTSAPELVISLLSALKGSSELAIGNVVGSNLFNTFLIVGITAAIIPISMSRGTLRKEIPLCILVSVALFICANDVWIDGASENIISRTDGWLLLCFFLIFMGYTFAIAGNSSDSHPVVKEMPMWKSILFILVGLAGLVFGGELFVNGASGIARSLGVSESVIGITLVAAGTSLPELATSVVAALKKNPEMAIGNVIGSNLFNILLVIGASAAIVPMPLGNINNVDLGTMIFSCVLLFVFGWMFKRQVIGRIEGLIMIGCYIVYIVYLLQHA